jgi:lambda family phage holin
MPLSEPDWFSHLLQAGTWLADHPLGFFTGLSAFIVSCWSGLAEGRRGFPLLVGGLVCVLTTLAVVAAMRSSGLHASWMPIVGIFVGFVGADRIRDAILSAWESRKIPPFIDSEKK